MSKAGPDSYETRVVALCQRLNIRIERRGTIWRITGPHVDITTTCLSMVREDVLTGGVKRA